MEEKEKGEVDKEDDENVHAGVPLVNDVKNLLPSIIFEMLRCTSRNSKYTNQMD